MKKLILKFSNDLLSREQIKSVKGGYKPNDDSGGTAQCSSKYCSYSYYVMNVGWTYVSLATCRVSGTPTSNNCMWVCPGSGVCS